MLKTWRGVSHFVALALVACGSEGVNVPAGSGEREPPASEDAAILISAPIPRASLPGGTDSSGSVVFVSAIPQALPRAVQALVQGADGRSVTASVRDGGFDPVLLPASSGDVVTVILTDGSGETRSEELAVRARRPPRVVRTNPAPRRTDVPLNAVIRVVFSAPVDLESARAAIVLTTASGSVVPGAVEAAGIVAVEYVITAGTLAPETTYRLEVTTGVRDLLGQALAEPVSVEFSTGGTDEEPQLPPRGIELLIAPTRIDLLPGASGQAEITIARGEGIGAVSLSASSPAGVRVTLSTSRLDTSSTTATVKVVVDSAVAVGTKDVVISAVGDGPRAVTVNKTLAVRVGAPPGTVALSISPARIIVLQGGSGQVQVTITRGGSFTGAVALGVDPDPNDPAVDVGVEVPSGIDPGSRIATASVYASATAALGPRTVAIRAFGEGIEAATATLNIEVVAPSGSLSISSPDPVFVAVGTPSVTTITLNRTAPFTGPVELTVIWERMPAGVTATISPSSATGGTATLSISAEPGTVNGYYQLQIHGTGTDILDASALVEVMVTGGITGIALTFDPAVITVEAGGPAETSRVRLSGRTPRFSMNPPPPGFTASFSGGTLTVQAEASVTPGTYFFRATERVSTADPDIWFTFRGLLRVVVVAPASFRQ